MSIDTSYRSGIDQLFRAEWTTFFATFARFEYAMKRSCYLKNPEPLQPANANWDSFADDLGTDFFQTCKVEPTLHVLFERPPRRLFVLQNCQVDFRQPRTANNFCELFLLVRDVRNSLFHGEKYVQRERDNELIIAALTLLDFAWQWARDAKDNSKLQNFLSAFYFYK